MKMMELEITVFKSTGKFYTNCIIETAEIPIFDDRFKACIFVNLPVNTISNDEYVIVRDTGKYDTQFHQRLFTGKELKSK